MPFHEFPIGLALSTNRRKTTVELKKQGLLGKQTLIVCDDRIALDWIESQIGKHDSSKFKIYCFCLMFALVNLYHSFFSISFTRTAKDQQRIVQLLGYQ